MKNITIFWKIKDRIKVGTCDPTPLLDCAFWNYVWCLYYVIGTALGQHINKIFHVIYYVSCTLNDAQLNYSMIEKKFLAIVYALDKF